MMRFPVVPLLLSAAVSALGQVERPLVLSRSHYTVTAGSAIALDAAPEALTFMKAAGARAARTSSRAFPVAPEYKGAGMMLGVPLTTAPGDYLVTLSFAGAHEERTGIIRLTVKPFQQPQATAPTPPVVLLDGLQLSLQGSCPIPQDSTGTFGHLQQYLEGAPNNVSNIYFFENCTECPQCAIEQLGAELASFLNSLAAPQVDVVAHSMGGLIVRSYLAGKSTASGVFNPPPTVKIRKAVFLATPHFGSPLADEASTNPLLSSLYGGDLQILEMRRGSQFAWDLATWNQFADDLRGVDAVAVIGNAGPSGQSDGVVDLTSASLDFAIPGRTRVVPYCHISASDVGGLAGAITGCTASGIAFIDSASHPSYQIASSFLTGGTAWQTIGNSPAQDPVLSANGGMLVSQLTASDQYVGTLQSVMWGSTALANGAAGSELFYNDFVPPGAASFLLTAAGSIATSGPYTEKAGAYSTFRIKASPAIKSVAPLSGSVTISGVGFGPQQCASCAVAISGAKSTSLVISNWSDTSITATLPATVSGFVTLGVTTANGSDAINFIATGGASPGMTIAGVTNSASGATGALAPGELVSIYGTNLGPAAGIAYAVDPATGGVGATLAGVRVLFGTVPAPILYASAGQINAVVPYEVAGQSQVTIAVEYQSQSATATLPVASAAPAIFTLTAGGSGQAAAFNQDGTVNGPANPSAKGSYVTLYFTGGGQTDPPGVTGSVTGLVQKWLAQSIAVKVGAQPVTVQFDGSAPTFVDGVDQLNIQLPSSTPSGAQAVLITVGGISSPSTATISVK